MNSQGVTSTGRPKRVDTESGELVPSGGRVPGKIVPPDGGLYRESVPGESLYFKVGGDDCEGAFDYLELRIDAKSGPPLHIHRIQHETIHFLKGDFKVQVGDDIYYCEEGSFVYFPVGVRHAFLNLSDRPGRCILTFVPGGAHKFFADFGPAVRRGAGQEEIAEIFQRWDWEVVGPQLTPD